MSVKHRYRSIDGAVRRVRQCEKLIAYLHQLTDRLNRERILLARLAAETPPPRPPPMTLMLFP